MTAIDGSPAESTIEAPKQERDKAAVFIESVINVIIAWIKESIRVIRLTIAAAYQPKKLILTMDQAEYIQSLFMSGSVPEDIARGMASVYGREAFPYFRIVNEKRDGYAFEAQDYDIQGLEFLRSAMIQLGAMTPKKDGDYYEASHPMVKKLASIAIAAPIPEITKGAK